MWASLTFGMVLLFLLGATLNAFLQPAETRAGWIGFALFGWAYLILNFGPWAKMETPPLPGSWPVERLLARVHPEPEYEPNPKASGWAGDLVISNVFEFPMRLKPGSVVWPGDRNHFRQVAHALAALAFALIGAAWAVWLSRRIARAANSQNST